MGNSTLSNVNEDVQKWELPYAANWLKQNKKKTFGEILMLSKNVENVHILPDP